MLELLPLCVVLVLVLWAVFVNGWTDAPNSIAVAVSTRVMSPMSALIMAAIFNFLGALLTGTAVAVTIGVGIVDPTVINLHTIAAAMIGIISWSTLAWYYGIPTSESHALVAGLAGAGLAKAGPSVLLWSGWVKVIVGLLVSTVGGLIAGYLLAVIVFYLARKQRPDKAQRVFGKLTIISSAFMAFSHGSQDGQKFMGVFALSMALYFGTTTKVTGNFSVDFWVILVCGIVMGFGTMIGGWRIIKSMGMKITKLTPAHAFCVQTMAASTIMASTGVGVPLSTTHTISSTIMGVGMIRGTSAVKWGVGLEFVAAWILTFPICATIAYVVTLLSMWLFPS